jgi:hypothetical protein
MSNKRVDFGNLGGFPLTQDVLNYMQATYRDAIGGLAKVCGTNVIVSGMEDNGVTVADGWIVYNGELIPFVGGPKQSTFILIDDNSTLQFEDGTIRTVFYSKYARFGSGGSPYDTLLRLSNIGALTQGLSDLNTTLSSLNNNLNSHFSDYANPHRVTKAQVGLSDIPNAVSDNPRLNRSDVLATTKATAAISKIALTGSYTITDILNGNEDQLLPIPLAQSITDPYLVAGSLRSVHYNNFDNDNDMVWMVRGLGVTQFLLCIKKLAKARQELIFDYAIILK